MMSSDFSNIVAYSVDKSAVITNAKIKPKRPLIVVVGFMLRLIMVIFVAMIKVSVKNKKEL